MNAVSFFEVEPERVASRLINYNNLHSKNSQENVTRVTKVDNVGMNSHGSDEYIN